MSLSNRLALPFIDAAQSQKHVTHNEALVELDALVHLSVKARNTLAPPAAPTEGDRYLIGAGAGGAFAGKANAVAAFDNGGWAFLSPRAGWRTFVEAEDVLLLFDGTNWTDLGLALHVLQNLSLLGVGATADAANPLSVKLNAALFAAKSTGEGGTGDLRVTLDKSASGATVSQIYQTNWSGRAETGLTGDDHFHIKVSPDGAVWREALNVDNATGKFSAPSGRIHAATGKDIADFVFTPGGDGQVSFYRVNRTPHYQNPRTATVASISGDAIALTTADANLFFETIMIGVSYVRIWNVTKNPNQSAWVRNMPDASHLQVLAAADIAGWMAGDVIQIGDPASITPNRVIAIDISQMMQNVLGAVFPQKAVLMKISIAASVAAASIAQGTSAGGMAVSATGASGSFVGVNLPSDGAAVGGQLIVPCSVLSPISNSNLIYVREGATVDGTLGIVLASANGVFV